MARMAQVSGALSIAMTSNPQSTLAQVIDHTLNLYAGPISVAATKTFVTFAIWLLAELAQDQELLAAIRKLPNVLEKAVVRTDLVVQRRLRTEHLLARISTWRRPFAC